MVRNNKHAQFKIQQTMFMILAVALFGILVFLFWTSVSLKNLHTLATNAEQDKAILMAQYISGMTELACSNKQYCIDTDKLMVLKNLSVYKDFWPANGIKIRKVYPSTSEIECTMSNYPNCNIYTIKDSGNSSVGTFISLCRQEKAEGYRRVCELGRIAVSYNIK